MRPCRPLLAVCAAILCAAPLAAQSFNLRDLLTDFLREGITLAPPRGLPDPLAHFTETTHPSSGRSAFSSQIAYHSPRSLSLPRPEASRTASIPRWACDTLPTASAVLRLPVYTAAKAASTSGVNYSHVTLRDQPLTSATGIAFVFTHEEPTTTEAPNPCLRGDVITARSAEDLKPTCGLRLPTVADRFDLAWAVRSERAFDS